MLDINFKGLIMIGEILWMGFRNNWWVNFKGYIGINLGNIMRIIIIIINGDNNIDWIMV